MIWDAVVKGPFAFGIWCVGVAGLGGLIALVGESLDSLAIGRVGLVVVVIAVLAGLGALAFGMVTAILGGVISQGIKSLPVIKERVEAKLKGSDNDKPR